MRNPQIAPAADYGSVGAPGQQHAVDRVGGQGLGQRLPIRIKGPELDVQVASVGRVICGADAALADRLFLEATYEDEAKRPFFQKSLG